MRYPAGWRGALRGWGGLSLLLAVLWLASGATRADDVSPPSKDGETKRVMRLWGQELARWKVEGVTHVKYRLRASGLTPEATYDMWVYDLPMQEQRQSEAKLPTPFKANSSGALESGFEFVLHRFARGQWCRFTLRSPDGRQEASATLIPFPLEARVAGRRIWLELVSTRGTAFLALGEGFEPGESVTTLSQSNGEVLRSQKRATQNGRLEPVYILPRARRGSHRASWTVKGITYALRIDYAWGAPAMRVQ